jgi:hypothetical protein
MPTKDEIIKEGLAKLDLQFTEVRAKVLELYKLKTAPLNDVEAIARISRDLQGYVAPTKDEKQYQGDLKLFESNVGHFDEFLIAHGIKNLEYETQRPNAIKVLLECAKEILDAPWDKVLNEDLDLVAKLQLLASFKTDSGSIDPVRFSSPKPRVDSLAGGGGSSDMPHSSHAHP